MPDEVWRKTYQEKPEWWDDPTEPRCDVCGVHTEDAADHVTDGEHDLDRYPGLWCGECGNCADHCVCYGCDNCGKQFPLTAMYSLGGDRYTPGFAPQAYPASCNDCQDEAIAQYARPRRK